MTSPWKSWGRLTLPSRVWLGHSSKGSETQFQFLLLGSLTSALLSSLRSCQNRIGGGEGREAGVRQGGLLPLPCSFSWVIGLLHGVGGGAELKALVTEFCFSVFFLLPNVAKAQAPSPRVGCKVTGQGCSPSLLNQHSQDSWS